MNIQIVYFQVHGDNRGALVALEEKRDIPFEIKRIYYMYDTKDGVRRGFHAHKNLRQAIFCPHGACTIRFDDGKQRIAVRLDSPTKGILVGPGIWREMFDFTEDAVLMVAASDYYDEKDYIRDYAQFLQFVKDGKMK